MSSQNHDSVVSLVMIIILLALTSLATVVYSGDAKQQARINNSVFWRTTKLAFDSTLSFLGIVTQVGLAGPQTGVVSSNSSNNQAPNNGFWSRTSVSIQDAWNRSAQGADSVASDQNQIKRFIEWKTLDNGAEIIFRPDSHSKYQLKLPWRFLGNRKNY